MKNTLSPSRFYISNIIFYICLLTSPSSATLEHVVNKPKRSESFQINATQRKKQEEEKNLEKKCLIAAKKGNLEKLKKLHKTSAINKIKHKNGYNVLHAACRFSDNVYMVNWLLDTCKIDIEAKGYIEKTPFLYAAEKGNLVIAKLLKQRGAYIKAKNSYHNNALHLACFFSGSENMVTWLLDECEIPIEAKGIYQRTPFLCAAEKGQLDIAKLLKQRGADINATDEIENNALHFACLFSGSEKMVTWLLDECKISIEAKGNYQRTPFLFASAKGQRKVAELLKERDANTNVKDKNGNNALHLACLVSGNEAMVTWLLDECKMPIETKGQYENTPFLCAVKKGRREIAKLLKQKGANIHTQEKDGDNALHLACFFSSSIAMVNWLLDACKIPIESKGCAQNTPFLCAAVTGQLQIAQLLKQKDADTNAKNNYENNALHLACLFSGSEDMVNWLLDECKIGIESKGYAQKTPYFCAVQEGQIKIAKLLKERGANIHAKD